MVRIFEREEPDLVLLDIMMPVMDGYEACERIKQAAGESFTPVILVTAKTESEALVKGFEKGADDHIARK